MKILFKCCFITVKPTIHRLILTCFEHFEEANNAGQQVSCRSFAYPFYNCMGYTDRKPHKDDEE